MAVTLKRIEDFSLNNPKTQEETDLTPALGTFEAIGITIVIPVFNEEKRLLKCVERTVKFCTSQEWDYELIIVEDGSTDRTLDLIKQVISRYSRVKLISNKERLGKGRAIRNGVLGSEKKFVGYMDVDLSADPSEFNRLLLYIDKFDIVVGSRILRNGLPPINRPAIRSILSSCYSRLFRALFRGVGVYDPQCGLKLFRTDRSRVLLGQIETKGFAFDCEVIVKASRLGMTVKEVPIIWEHSYGSKVCLIREIAVMGKDLLSVWYKSKTSKRRYNPICPTVSALSPNSAV